MKPGRELDALVAEKVMGWELARDTPFPGVDRRCWRRPGKTSFSSALRHFSTDIAAAWEVVGHLRNDHWVVHVVLTDEGVSAKLGDSYWVPEVFADSETAPHAICLAALRSVGVEVDDG